MSELLDNKVNILRKGSTYNGNVDLGQPEVYQRIQESSKVQDGFVVPKAGGVGDARNQRHPNSNSDHYVNEAHDVGLGVLQDVFSP